MSVTNSKLISLLFITALFLSSCNRSPHKIIDAEHLDKYVVQHAENIYYDLFKACEQDSINCFVSNAYVSQKMRQQILNGKYKNLCGLIDDNIGEITSIEIHEAVYFKNILVAFRYKMTGTKIEEPIEFRLVLTIDNLLSSIGFYDWNEEYAYTTHKKEWAKRRKL